MLKRKIEQLFLEWKKQEKKPCLLVRGARQVGKTYIIEHFAKENYENYIYINFELNPEYKDIFSGNLDFDAIKPRLETTFPSERIEKGKTLLFLDEIQSCPNARVALKAFSMDGTLDVIASGSLLGLYYKEVSSYPVGFERPVDLYPLDFEEFLWALGLEEETIGVYRDAFENKKTLDPAIASKLNEYFRTYMLVGGMPSVVNTYLETKSLQDTLSVQRQIVENYKNDILKYADTRDKQKILKTLESIPSQLSKKNRKFMFSDIDPKEENVGERKYGSSVLWLKDAGLLNFCYNVKEPALPLNANRNLGSFKLYMRDTGLLISMLETGTQKAILDDELGINAGGITENVCAGEIAAHNHDLTYFERRGKLEIDFVMNLDGKASAIEIKSGKDKQAKSLNSIIENYKTVSRYIMFEENPEVVVDEKGIEHYPLFMVMFL